MDRSGGPFLYQTAKITIEKYQMLQKKDRIVLGVSGGADSSALLHFLVSLREEYQLFLCAVHVNHGIRKQEAFEDELFVKELCDRLCVPFYAVHYNVKSIAQQEKRNEEETGRKIRYQEFEKALVKYECNKIAVAHNRNDQAETVLMRLCRGTGLTGLTGILPVRENIIRPLLFCDRKMIEKYCHEHSLCYRTDSTNQMQRYTRNKVRLTLIPWLEKELNQNVVYTISNMANVLLEEDEFLEAQAEVSFQKALEKQDSTSIFLNIQTIKALPIVLQRRVLRCALKRLRPDKKDVSFEHIQSLLALMNQQTGHKISLPLGLIAQKQYQLLKVSCFLDDKNSGYCYNIGLGETVYIKECRLFLKMYLDYEENVEKQPGRYTKAFDYDKIKSNLQVRTRKAGDKIAFKNLGGMKKIKDFFIDEKIPKQKRDSIPLIASGSDILWILGYRANHEYLADYKTEKKVWIEYWEDV